MRKLIRGLGTSSKEKGSLIIMHFLRNSVNETVTRSHVNLIIDFSLHFRCCPTSKVLNVSKDGNDSWIRGTDSSYTKLYEKIACPGEESNGTKECKDGSYEEYLLDSRLYNFSINGTKLSIKNNCDFNAEAKVIDKLLDNFCVSGIILHCIFDFFFNTSKCITKYISGM